MYNSGYTEVYTHVLTGFYRVLTVFWSRIYTLGHAKISIFGYPTIFSIIPNKVPVEEDGVLGSEYFQDNNVNINYTSKCLEIENHCYSFKSTNTLTD